MASGVNKVILVGNLGNDPELRHTAGGQAVCNFSLATNESWNDKHGQRQERVEWHRIIVWGNHAEACSKYLAKGRQAYVEGKLQTRSWEDRDGIKRYTTEVVAQQVQFLGGGNGQGRREEDEQPRNGGGDYFSGSNHPDDDIPFAVAADGLDRLITRHDPGRRAL